MPEKTWLRNDPNRPVSADLARVQEAAAKVLWPTHEPLWFYRNRGSAHSKEVKRATGYQSPENVALMAATGIQMPVRAHFFKGAGLIHERSSIEKTIAYAKLVRDHGMLVSVYVGGTMFTDYFFKEVPQAIHWARKDQDGNPITYGSYQLQRWFPCLNNPDYRAYTKKVLDVAVREIQADEIFFDNQILRHEPRSCRCDYCVKHLRDMIRAKYTLEQCEERYGFAEYPDVVPPIFSQACKPWRMDRVGTPQIQDWIDHRVQTVIEFYREMAEHVKQRPATAVGMNIKGIHGHNHAFDHGICHGSFSDLLDYSCIDGYTPGVHDDTVVSEVRFWKSSHSTHISVVDEPRDELPAAEGQVYGYRKWIEGHGWLGGIGDCSAFTPMTHFLRGNQHLFHERKRLQDVAVLRSEPSTNYNCAKVHEQLMAFEQSLAAEKIPWGIIFDRQIDSLAAHRIVALPEIQAISDVWLDRLDQFMQAGGGVIASGQAAQYNEWYRLRDPERGLARWLGKPPGDKYISAKVGKGRLVYVPTWDVAVKWDFSDWFMASRPKPVLNRNVFLKAIITDASGGRPLTHRITGNKHVFAESIAAEGGVDVHFINYNAKNTKPVMSVQISAPAGVRRAQVTVTDPHMTKPRVKKVASVLKGGVVAFKMFTPKVYGLAQVRFG